MEESKNNQANRKITIKMGGGGIGAVVLVGGALATAALASAFVVGRNGRSSGKDRRRRRHKSPPPREIYEEKEQDEADKAQQINVVDKPSHVNQNPSGAIKEVESDNDTCFLVSNHSSTLDGKPEEINGETPNGVEEIDGGKQDDICDIETTDQNLGSISLEKIETDAVSDGSVIIEEKAHLLDENLQFEPRNMMQGDEVTIQLTKEIDVYNEIPEESQSIDQVHVEEERAESEPIDDVIVINGTSHREAVEVIEKQLPQQEDNNEEIKVALVDNAVDEVRIDQKEDEKNVNMTKVDMEEKELEEGHKCNNGEMVLFESHSEDGEKTLLPVLDSRVIEHENVNADEEKGMSLSGKVDIVKENEFIEGSEEDDQVKHVDEQLVVKEPEECDQPDEIIVVEKCEDPIEVIKDDEIPSDIREENDSIVYPVFKEEVISPENIEVKNHHGNDIGSELEKARDDTTDDEAAEITEVDKNETVLEFTVGQQKQHEDEVERNIAEEIEHPVIKTSQDEEKGENPTKDFNDEKVQLIDQEVEGKVQEDKAIKKDEHGSKDSKIIGDEDSSLEPRNEKQESYHDNIRRFSDEKGDSERTLIKKYMAELAMPNDHLTNSVTVRRVIIATLSVLSSLSCSWFFGLSLVKLCLVVFLTMVMSSMVTE